MGHEIVHEVPMLTVRGQRHHHGVNWEGRRWKASQFHISHLSWKWDRHSVNIK